jgi:ADP-ribose pyrophosphatase YjhB (NUDIX family)
MTVDAGPIYCIACGGWLAPAGTHWICTQCARATYRNSKPCAGALIVDKGRLLMVRRAREPWRGWWDIPGGFLDNGESPSSAVVREVLEETGLEVRPTRLFGLYIDKYLEPGEYTLNIYYECAILSGTARPHDDADAIEWFPVDALPDNVAFPCQRQLLRDWRANTPPL